MAQYFALHCISDIWQNSEKPLISNRLRFIVTCLLSAALWVLFHMAHHGFATLALCKGMPIESVSRILGHTNIETTQIYAKITVEKLDNDLTMLGDKLSKSFGNIKMAGI